MRVSLATRHQEPSYIPLGLLYLKAALVEGAAGAGEVQVLEFPPDAGANTIAEAISRTRPDVVGLSCYVWNVRVLLEAARQITAPSPDVRIVIGGPEVGPVGPGVLRRHAQIDVVVRSEGEVPLRRLVDTWDAAGSLSQVKGIDYRQDGAVYSTPDAPIVANLSDIPSPHLARYAGYTGRVVCFETQRGCVFKCNFCFYKQGLLGPEPPVRSRAREGGVAVLTRTGRRRNLLHGSGVQPQPGSNARDLPLPRRARSPAHPAARGDLGGVRGRRDGGLPPLSGTSWYSVAVGSPPSEYASRSTTSCAGTAITSGTRSQRRRLLTSRRLLRPAPRRCPACEKALSP